MSKYTKGPWKVDGGTGLCISSDNGKTFIGSASLHSENHYEEAKANANLIAAAPELLEALEQMLLIVDCCDETEYVDGHGFVDIESIKQKALAIVAKAKGEL